MFLKSFVQTSIRFALIALIAVAASLAHAAPRMPVSRQEFEALATELAPKVNMFAEIWKADPTAEMFGGTSRDFLYWLKGQLLRKTSRSELESKIRELRSLRIIDVREFILYESDVDVVSHQWFNIDGGRFGVKKIDRIGADRFDPKTAEGQNEIKQGYIPVEKIRLRRNGFVRPGVFGDGVGEVYDSKPTVHFASAADFAETYYAKHHLNHPVLLAFRYLRILAMNDFQTYGKSAPTQDRLESEMDFASFEKVRSVLKAALGDLDLETAMEQEKFRGWINGAIQKAFRSYTNPASALELMKMSGAMTLIAELDGLEPINQYLFAKHRDQAKIEANWKAYGQSASSHLISVRDAFPDGKLYHGTRTEIAFRSIIFQGILPSEGGTGGAGLYGVALENKSFAETWGGDANRLVEIEISPAAKIIDLNDPDSMRLFEDFRMRHPKVEDPGSAFAEEFGIDIVKYVYSPEAFVVKNGAVVLGVQGTHRKLMKFSEMLEAVRKLRSDNAVEGFFDLVVDNRVNHEEYEALRNEVLPLLPASVKGDPDSFLVDHLLNRIAKATSKSDVGEIPSWIFSRVQEAMRRKSDADVAKGIDVAIANRSAYALALLIATRIDRAPGTTDMTRQSIARELASPEAQVKTFGETAGWVLSQYGGIHLTPRQILDLTKAMSQLDRHAVKHMAYADPTFATAEAREFLGIYAKSDRCLQLLLDPYPFRGLGDELPGLTSKWSPLDALLLRKLEKLTMDVRYTDRIADWLDRVKVVAPQRLNEAMIEKLFRHAVATYEDGRSSYMTDAIVRTLVELLEFPGVERMKIGTEIVERALIQESQNGGQYQYDHSSHRKRLAEAIKTRWVGHPRHAIWMAALELPLSKRAAFLKRSKTPVASCESLF